MAAIWTTMTVKEAVVLEYGPAGTTCFAKRNMQRLDVDADRLVTTHLRENDVIMGDTARLEMAVKKVDEDFAPKAIFVIPSCVMSVVGADIGGLCNNIQGKVKAKLIPFEGAGFTGDYSNGLRRIYSLMVENLVTPVTKTADGTYNILGASILSDSMSADIEEIHSLMRTAFQSKPAATLGIDASVTAIKRMGEAAVNLVMRAEALPAAMWLREQCGTPYIYPAPYGYTGTMTWLQEVGDAIGQKPSARILTWIHDRTHKLKINSKKREGLSVFGEYDHVAGISRFADGLGIVSKTLLCRHELGTVENRSGNIRHLSAEKEWIDATKGLHNQWVLTDTCTAGIVPRDNAVMEFRSTTTRNRRYGTPCSVMGLCGAERIRDFFRNM
jgi:nitrogenase molybdenum-cofactor synthesis protein NifE